MKTLETDIEIAADGSIKLLSPLPDWLKPGRAHIVLTVADADEGKPEAGDSPGDAGNDRAACSGF